MLWTTISGIPPETKATKVTNHYCRVWLSGKTMTLEAVDLSGAVFDREQRILKP